MDYRKYIKFERLLTLVGEQPFFEMGLLLSGMFHPAHVQRHVSRWVRSGRIRQ